jgi:drug/metabolite transporter (DMT)-like permease
MIEGIIFAFFSSIISGISLFLQKISLIKISNWKEAIRSPKWLFSISLNIPAFYLFLLAIKFERLMIIQPITYASLFVTIILEMMILKYKFNSYEISAIALFLIGALFITDSFCSIFNILCW